MSWSFPRPTPTFDDLLGGLTGLSIIIQLRCTTAKGYKAEGKGTWVKSEGNQAQAFKSLLPVESCRIHLITPALNCNNTREMLPAGEAH